MPPLKGPQGVQSVAFTPAQGISPASFAITNNASKAQQVAIMRMINYLFTPLGAQTETYGPEGLYWKPAAKGQDGLVPQQALYNTFNGQIVASDITQNTEWNDWFTWDYSYPWRELAYSAAPFTPNGNEALDDLEERTPMANHQPRGARRHRSGSR